MIESHEHLDELFGRLLDAMAANAPDVRELWTELDHGLLAHMEAEERFLLPAFARSDERSGIAGGGADGFAGGAGDLPRGIDHQEALALLHEHGQIREQLLELGVAVDLHCIRLEQSREFIATLRAHADREDKLLYRWADARLDPRLIEATRRHASAR